MCKKSPPRNSLPVDQPFRYDGPIGAKWVSCSTLPLRRTPIPGIPDSQSLRASSQALSVSAHSTLHMFGIPSNTRIQFWRTLATVHRVSQLHSSIPLLLAGDSNIWFPFFQLGRSRQADAPLLPIAQEILRILSSPSLSTPITRV